MRKIIAAIIAALAIALLAACGGGSMTATQRVQHDGYTTVLTVNTIPQEAKPYIAEMAAGMNGNGQAEAVIKLTPEGQSMEPMLEAELSGSGLTAHNDGPDTLTIQGPESAFSGLAS
jgi:hypothetical protein